MNRFKLILLPAVLVFASCADEGNEPAPAAGREISFNFTQDAPAASRAHDDAPLAPRPFTLVSDDVADTTTLQVWMTVDDMSAPSASRSSRGLPVTGADGITGFKAYSFFYSAADAVPTVFFADEDVTRAGTNLYQTSQKYFWPDAGKNLSFRALVGTTDATTVTASATAPGEIDIDYTVSAQAADQPDLMLARTAPLNTPGTPVPLSFTHLCAQVKFVIGSQMQPGTIKSITLSGIKSHGVYAATDGWTVTDTEREFTITPGRATTGTETPGTLIPAEELTLMMLPQTLSPTARLTVEFDDAFTGNQRTLSASLADQVWSQGKSTAYHIGISPEFKLEFTADVQQQDAHYVVCNSGVRISGLPAGKSWTLTITSDDASDPSVIVTDDMEPVVREFVGKGYWLDKKMTDGVATNESTRGTNTIKKSGSGDFPLTIFLPENINTANRTYTLSLSVDGAMPQYTVTQTITQLCPARQGNIGWEQIEESMQGVFGFNYVAQHVYVWRESSILASTTDNIIDKVKNLISTYSAGAFTKIARYYDRDIERLGFRHYINIDYASLNGMQDGTIAQSRNDGLLNTRDMFTFAGTAISQNFENALLLMHQRRDTSKPAYREADSTDPAAVPEFVRGTIESINQILAMALKKNRYYLNTSTVDNNTTTTPLIKAEDIVWFIPACDQFAGVPAWIDGTTMTRSEYWSSTATTANNNTQAYDAAAVATDRGTMKKLRVARTLKSEAKRS